MKLSKLMLLCTMCLMAGSLIANEAPVDTSSTSHTPYIGYEFGSNGIHRPSVGYRYQNGSYIVDVNGGYKYFGSACYPLHFWKAGVNAYTSLCQTDEGQLYAGVGVDVEGCRTKSYYGYSIREYAVQPSVSIGRDFTIENTKVFLELSYKPYEFGKDEDRFCHTTGFRVGVGF